MEACYVFHCLLVFIWQWMLLLFQIQLDNISWSQRSTNLDKVAKINCTCLSSFRYSYHRASLKYIYFVERINSPSSLYNGKKIQKYFFLRLLLRSAWTVVYITLWIYGCKSSTLTWDLYFKYIYNVHVFYYSFIYYRGLLEQQLLFGFLGFKVQQ